MRVLYVYLRLILASWLFLGGLALQFVPSAAAVERDARHRERMIQAVPAADRDEWLRLRDRDDARAEAALRLFGVMLGGLGLGMALIEVVHASARKERHCPLDAPER